MASDPYKYFRIESRELMEQLGQCALELEKSQPTPEHVSHMLRLAHTLKGAARVVKQREIADLAHSLEEVLTDSRDIVTVWPRERVDAVLDRLDAMGTHVRALELPKDTEGTSVPRPSAEEIFKTVRADIEDMDELVEGVSQAQLRLATLRRSFVSLDRVRQLAELLADQLRSPRMQRPGDSWAVKSSDLAKELSELSRGLEGGLEVGLEEIDRELRQVRTSVERLRLLPVGLMFNVLERTARDAATSVGKRVVFQTRGADVRIDAHVLGIIQGALVQVVRNAVAHGIESESQRAAAAKPPEGRVTLEVIRRGKRVCFACRDDGGGFDIEAVRRVAVRSGWIAQGHGLSPEALIRRLLEGGISTSGTVTEVSGRGIGLDVVREAANRLGGEIAVHNEMGKGATIEIEVPVSQAALEALLVEAGERAAVIPLDAVRRTLRVSARDVAHTPTGDSIVLDGMVVPFVPLARSLRGNTGTSGKAWSAVVIESSGTLVAIGVDRLLGTRSIVLRPLPGATPVDPVVAGVSLDAEGDPQIVLDAEALVAEAGRLTPTKHATAAPRRPILVIDDSLTTRMLEQSILESAGYEVDLATSGEEALVKASARHYALFLVDVEMPGMDGFEFIERTRAHADLRQVPAILVTSRNAPEDRQRGEQVGASVYIVKSDFDQTELLERIRKLVG